MDDVLDRPALLATGHRHPLGAVAGCLGLLASFLDDPADRPLVTDLRRLSLDLDLPADRRAALTRAGLLAADGSLDPLVRDVVRAAVRGTGHRLHLETPFTDPTDQAVADLVTARDYLRSHMPGPEADAVLGPDSLYRAIDALRASGRWAGRVAPRPPGDDAPPLP